MVLSTGKWEFAWTLYKSLALVPNQITGKETDRTDLSTWNLQTFETFGLMRLKNMHLSGVFCTFSPRCFVQQESPFHFDVRVKNVLTEIFHVFYWAVPWFLFGSHKYWAEKMSLILLNNFHWIFCLHCLYLLIHWNTFVWAYWIESSRKSLIRLWQKGNLIPSHQVKYWRIVCEFFPVFKKILTTYC